MKSESPVDLNKEKDLIKALKALPETANPSRDLWPGIASQLSERETKTYTPRWIPWAIAATLVVSFSSIFVSWNNLQSAQEFIADNRFSQQGDNELALKGDIQAQIESMEQEFRLAKSALLAQIGMNSSQTNMDLMQDVKSNLIIIEQATSQLKAAIIKQPENPGLPALLQATYQQELAVLRQLAKLDVEA